MPITNVLDFEKPLAELDAAIDELRSVSEAEGIDRADEISAQKTRTKRWVPAATRPLCMCC